MPFIEFLLNSFDLPTIFWEYNILIYTHHLLYDAHILLAMLVILIYNYIIIIIF
jgi:hypothetical protein